MDFRLSWNRVHRPMGVLEKAEEVPGTERTNSLKNSFGHRSTANGKSAQKQLEPSAGRGHHRYAMNRFNQKSPEGPLAQAAVSPRTVFGAFNCQRRLPALYATRRKHQ